MKLDIDFGSSPQTVEIPDRNIVDVLEPNEVAVSAKGATVVEVALQHPIGAPRLSELTKPSEKIVIITSDVTRPVPSYKIIPAVLEELWQAGVNEKDITVVFALGRHRGQTQDEMKRLVGKKSAAVFAASTATQMTLCAWELQHSAPWWI